MNQDTWVSHYQYGSVFSRIQFDSFSDTKDEIINNIVSVDSILPDDLLERILACLPIASLFRAGCVCKRWHNIVSSKCFLWNPSYVISQKPWYFMFTSTDEPYGYSYDPTLKKWYDIDLPFFITSNWFVASSFGLVCFMNKDSRSELHVYNPITKLMRTLIGPPGIKVSDYSALSISSDKKSHIYNISIVKSKQIPDNFYQWDLSIHVYNSETMMWVTVLTEVLNGWRAGDESVICGEFLYFLLYSTGGGSGLRDCRHGLIKYNLSTHYSHGLLTNCFIGIPCALTCGRLMNVNKKLVMVGGIGKQDRYDIIKGIGIWVLNGSEWKEMGRMPHKYFQGFGEFDDVFASSGTDDLIYIQSYGAPSLLLFDINSKQWRWSQKCPVTKRFPLQLFTGFCFEPRLEISP